MVDFLLINAGNYEANLIYPYAFVQVRAIAKVHGLDYACHDLFGLNAEETKQRLEFLISKYNPKMVGLHIRQADSIFLKDYTSLQFGSNGYFPLNNAKFVIQNLRSLTSAPIVIGGFGFTTYLEPVLRYLGADFGISGEPDDLFEKFDLALSGGYDKIRNAVWIKNGSFEQTERYFFPPLPTPEYDDEVLDEMERFYSRTTLYGKGQPTVAVELARGCPFSCYFCSEPNVKGREVRQRNLDVVMTDVEFLVSRGIRRFWLVCSELNIGNNNLALAVADRFQSLNKQHSTQRITWQAYHLPRWLTREDIQKLYDSGFDGGWNDFPSLDDENLVKCRVPYRSDDVAFHLTAKSEIHNFGPNGTPPYLSLFLGNAYATPKTISATLQRLHSAGLGERYPTAEVGVATRLFPFHLTGKYPPPPGTFEAFSMLPDGTKKSSDIIFPTFFYAPAIRKEFATDQDLAEFMEYLSDTLLSNHYVQKRDLQKFHFNSMQRPWYKAQWKLQAEASERNLDKTLPEILVLLIQQPSLIFNNFLESLNLRLLPEETPYYVLKTLLKKWENLNELYSDFQRETELSDSSREIWMLDYYLFRLNIKLSPQLRNFIL
ncbi:MAG: hypothetical protein WAV85_17245 [Rhodoferax sp.]